MSDVRGVGRADREKAEGELNFYVPASNVPLLKKVRGFEDFNPAEGVLHSDRPGAGLVDAPLVFSIKLGRVTRDKCSLIPARSTLSSAAGTRREN